jgi:hypothetical protein
VDALGAFLAKNKMTIVDPPGEYYDNCYYAVYFIDPDGMKLEGMVFKPPARKKKAGNRRVGHQGRLRPVFDGAMGA